MSDPAIHLALRRPGRALAGPALLFGFAATLFAAAWLLFLVQPIVSRLVLPRLGGSPAVWNTCVCFFQAALLLGYGYAHLLATRLKRPAQIALHALVLAGGIAVLPLSLGDALPGPEAAPVPWLLGLLAVQVGPAFAALAATAPLLQHWFAGTGHPHARDPYALYAASNAGSLVALLGYPVAVETVLDLPAQAALWSAGFAATAAAVLGCGLAALRQRDGSVPRTAGGAQAAPGARIAPAERLRWLLLAFLPAALMLAVTTHVTTDIAAVPLFWVVPLALYILTFVLAFARDWPAARQPLLRLQGVALAAAGLAGLHGTLSAAAMLAPLTAFALTAAVCHAELARRRPDVRHLTGYFLLISVGGALGGLFNALLAPLLFPLPLEYPLLLVAACLLRPAPAPLPTRRREDWAARGDLLLPCALILLLVALRAAEAAYPAWRPAAAAMAVLLPAAALLWFAARRVRLALGLALCLAVPVLAGLGGTQHLGRSFFGVLRVVERPAEQMLVLAHGTTAHGVRSTRPGEELTPFGYYHQAGPFGRFFAARAERAAAGGSVGVIGLGTGVLGCYARPGEAWTFYEIDPLVERIARDTRWFPFLTDCGNRPAVVLGDARLTLAADAAARHDVLVVDAFSSDSVPVHLLTREALALYLARLNPGGVLLFHVSNRYLELAPVVARLAAEAGAAHRHLAVPSAGGGLRHPGAEVVAVARMAADLALLDADGWREIQPGPVLWTDARSDILRVIRWR